MLNEALTQLKSEYRPVILSRWPFVVAPTSWRIFGFSDSSGTTRQGRHAQLCLNLFLAWDARGQLDNIPMIVLESEAKKSPRVTPSSLSGECAGFVRQGEHALRWQ